MDPGIQHLGSCFFTGKSNFNHLTLGDWSWKSLRFNVESRAKATDLLGRLNSISDRLRIDLGEPAIAWVLKNEKVMFAPSAR